MFNHFSNFLKYLSITIISIGIIGNLISLLIFIRPCLNSKTNTLQNISISNKQKYNKGVKRCLMYIISHSNWTVWNYCRTEVHTFYSNSIKTKRNEDISYELTTVKIFHLVHFLIIRLEYLLVYNFELCVDK